MNYYNEFDPRAAAWLRQLMLEKLIPEGKIDERSITEVTPGDLSGFCQCHFFAGIGGWSYALQLAGWPSNKPIWTASLPCQPFSRAGKRKGNDDERHLWPTFFNLVRECSPVRLFGEQVAQAIGFGWLDGISTDLEAENYTIGACVLGAHSVGAPHRRNRLYWVAHTNGRVSEDRELQRSGQQRQQPEDSLVSGVVQSDSTRRYEGELTLTPSRHWGSLESTSGAGGMGNSAHAKSARNGEQRNELPRSTVGGLAHNGSSGLEIGHEQSARQECPPSERDRANSWDDYEFIPCADGKKRRIKSGLQPLAHGVSGRVGLLRGYGNAIVPQVAAEFIIASGL